MIHSQRQQSWRRHFVPFFVCLLMLGCGLLLLRSNVQAQTADPLATALTNAGMDPTQATAYAAAFELTLASQKTFVTATNNALANLPKVSSGVFVVPPNTSTATILAPSIGPNSVVTFEPTMDVSAFPAGTPPCTQELNRSSERFISRIPATSFTVGITYSPGQTCWQYTVIG